MSIRSAYKYTHRTTLRIDTDLWKRFKKHCKFHGLTTCFVMRALMQQWLSRETYRKYKTKKGKWKYFKEPQTLFRLDSLSNPTRTSKDSGEDYLANIQITN